MTYFWSSEDSRAEAKLVPNPCTQKSPVKFHIYIRVRKKGSFGKGVFWKRGLFRKVHFLEILESPQTVENNPPIFYRF